MDYRHSCRAKLVSTDSLRAKSSHVRLEACSVQSQRDLGHLAFASPLMELAGEQKYRMLHASLGSIETLTVM